MNRAAVLLLLLAVACKPAPEAPVPMGPVGDERRGKLLVVDYGCNVCHIIPGTPGPQGSLGPSLQGVGARPAIGNATVPNTPANLTKYIAEPQSLYPQSTMPAWETRIGPKRATHPPAAALPIIEPT